MRTVGVALSDRPLMDLDLSPTGCPGLPQSLDKHEGGGEAGRHSLHKPKPKHCRNQGRGARGTVMVLKTSHGISQVGVTKGLE